MSRSHAAALAALSLLATGIAGAMPTDTAAPTSSITQAPVGEQFVDGESVALEQLHWSGRLQFQDVYCVDFPQPEQALTRLTGIVDHGAVALARVDYADGLLAYVVASTLPAGRTGAQEHAAQLALAQHSHARLGTLFDYEIADSAVGPVLRRHLNNVAVERGAALFPLELAFYDSARTLSVAESRIFARGPDRFEVAALGFPGQDATPQSQSRLRATVAAAADRLQAALQRCTGGMAVRTP